MVRLVPVMVGSSPDQMRSPEDFYTIIKMAPGEQVVPPLDRAVVRQRAVGANVVVVRRSAQGPSRRTGK
jgi:hypothetical protein